VLLVAAIASTVAIAAFVAISKTFHLQTIQSFLPSLQ
jgi:hypothetical protein